MKLSLPVLCVSVIVLLIVTGSPLLAGQTATELNSEDAKSIKAIIDNGWKSLQKKDLEGFKKHCTDSWVLFSADGLKINVDQLFEMYNTTIKNFKLDTSEWNIRVVGDMAYATYDAKVSGEVQGGSWEESFIFTNIFQKENGKWMGIHTHESKK